MSIVLNVHYFEVFVIFMEMKAGQISPHSIAGLDV